MGIPHVAPDLYYHLFPEERYPAWLRLESTFDYSTPRTPAEFVPRGGRFGGGGVSSLWNNIFSSQTGSGDESPGSWLDWIDELLGRYLQKSGPQAVTSPSLPAAAPAPVAAPAPIEPIAAPPAELPFPATPGAPTHRSGVAAPVVPKPFGMTEIPFVRSHEPLPLSPEALRPLDMLPQELMRLLPSHLPIASSGASIPLVPPHRPSRPGPPPMTRRSDVIPEGVGLPIPPPMPIEDYRAGRVPAEIPTWEFPGGRISVPGGEEALARIRQQAQEWLERQMSSTPKRKVSPVTELNLSLPPAGARFPAKVIEESWGRESEASELEKARKRAEIAASMAESDARRSLPFLRLAEIEAKQNQRQEQGEIQSAIMQAAEAMATKGVPIEEAVEVLQPLFDAAYSAGVRPRYGTPTSLYNAILRRRGAKASDDGIPPPPRASEVAKSRDELLKRAGLTR